MALQRQASLFNKIDWRHKFSYGGALRQERKGRGLRPLSCKEPLHVVFKVNKNRLRHKSLRSAMGFSLIQKITKQYAKKFFVKVDQISIQHDHIHILIRTNRRSLYHYFFRVVAGQIAQRFEKQGLYSRVTDTSQSLKAKTAGGGTHKISLWKYRPFSRIVRGWRAYRIVRAYIQLNEKEVTGKIKYQSLRLKGLSMSDWNILWI